MNIFALQIFCPITSKSKLFPRDCILSNDYVLEKERANLFPELRCSYLEIGFNPKTKRVTFKCTHKDSKCDTTEIVIYKGKNGSKK